MKNPFLIFKRREAKHESARHAKRNWKKRNTTFSVSNTVLCLSLLFLFIPLFVIVLYSFNASKDTRFTQFSFVWYQKLIFESKPLAGTSEQHDCSRFFVARCYNSGNNGFYRNKLVQILRKIVHSEHKFSSHGSSRSYYGYFHAHFL